MLRFLATEQSSQGFKTERSQFESPVYSGKVPIVKAELTSLLNKYQARLKRMSAKATNISTELYVKNI